MSKRRVVWCGALVLGACVVGGTREAKAAEPGFAVNKFEPAERNSEWFANDTLDLRGGFRPAVGVTFEGQTRPLVGYRPDGSILFSPVRNMQTLHVGAAVNLFDRLRIGLNLPIVVFEDGHQVDTVSRTASLPANDQSLGDLRVGADFRLYGVYGDPVTVALGAQVWLPTGDKTNYTSDGVVRAAPHISVAGESGVFTYAAKVGFMFGRSERYFLNTKQGQELTMSVAAGFRVLDRHLVVGPEVWASAVVLSDPSNTPATGLQEPAALPVEAILGAHYTAGIARFGLGGGIGITRAIGSPESHFMASFEIVPEFNGDSDGDGVADKDDACPGTSGVADADPKKNGCPPDADADGIYDGDDFCPSVAGVRSLDPKKNGCPSDGDGDGVYDKDDACIDLAGVSSSNPSKNGCPEDRDGDGIYDKDDACIDLAGKASSNPKTNGCPADQDSDGIYDKDDACIDLAGKPSAKAEFNGCPADLDGDGVANEQDACPKEVGKPDADPTKNGCPKAFVQAGVIRILDQVKFKSGSAEIVAGKDSEEILQAVLKVLKDHAEIKSLDIQGHTDNVGNAAFNKKLSGDRAASVVKWLVKSGIDKSRLTSQGFGQEKPIGDNKTEDGRRINRRVEFHIVDNGTAPATPTTH